MANFEGVLASIPGLAGYLAKGQFDTEQQQEQMKIAALMRQQQDAEQIKGILSQGGNIQEAVPALSRTGLSGLGAAKSLLEVEKARQDAALGAQLTAGGSNLTPDQMDALALKLGVGGHPGASTLTTAADRRRKLQDEQRALVGMQASPEVQTVGEFGPNVPQPARTGSVPDYLLNDKQFGPSAKALQDRINRNLLTSTAAESELSRLSTAYNTAKQNEAMIGLRGAEARQTKATAPGVNAQGELTADAIEQAATAYNINKTLPTNLGRGTQGAVNTAKILNRAAEQQKDAGNTAEATAIQQISNKASTMALGSLSKDLAAIGPFHDMLNTNAKIAIDLAKKISSSRTGSQFANRPLSWLQNNATDNPDIAEYLFQMQIVKTEGARILNNPRLVGQLTDSARAEMGNVINGNMPLGQTERVLKRMMSDGDNRVNAMQSQREVLLNSMKVNKQTAPTQAIPSPNRPAPPPGFTPL